MSDIEQLPPPTPTSEGDAGAAHDQAQQDASDDRLKALLAPYREMFNDYRQGYVAALSTILCSGDLKLESPQPESGIVRMEGWRVGVTNVPIEPGKPPAMMPVATYIKVRGGITAERSDAQPPMAKDTPLVSEYYDLREIVDRPKDVEGRPFFRPDTLIKVVAPLVRSDETSSGRHVFEREAVAPDGSIVSVPFAAPRQRAGKQFPSYEEVLGDEVPSGATDAFDALVETATEKVRRQLAGEIWDTHFAGAFNQGLDLKDVPRSSGESASDKPNHDNPLRHIVRYAGARALADFDKDVVVDVFMNPKIGSWAADLRSVETDGLSENQYQTRLRAQWAADYAPAFQAAVEQRLKAAHRLIRDCVEQELVPFRKVTQKAQQFAYDLLAGASLGEEYDGGIWKMVR